MYWYFWHTMLGNFLRAVYIARPCSLSLGFGTIYVTGSENMALTLQVED